MKYTTILGLLLIALGVTAFFFKDTDFVDLVATQEFIIGILLGAGVGFLLGGFFGWLYKKPYNKKEKATNKISDTTEL